MFNSFFPPPDSSDTCVVNLQSLVFSFQLIILKCEWIRKGFAYDLEVIEFVAFVRWNCGECFVGVSSKANEQLIKFSVVESESFVGFVLKYVCACFMLLMMNFN